MYHHVSNQPATTPKGHLTHVVEPNRGHLRQPKGQHGSPSLQPNPPILGRILRAEPKHQKPARGHHQWEEHGRQPILCLRHPAPLLLRLVLQLPVRQHVRVDIADDAPNHAADVDQPDVGTPQIRRHGNQLRTDERDGHDATNQPGVVQHDHPRAREQEGAPRLDEVVQQAAVGVWVAAEVDVEGVGEGV